MKRMFFLLFLAIFSISYGRVDTTLLGARQMINSDAQVKYTAKDYVQEGLVALWDGIENAGWGIHNDNSPIWKDLTGNGMDATIVDGIWTKNGLTVSKRANNAVLGATIYGYENSIWFTEDGPFVIDIAVDTSALNIANWSENVIYEDNRVHIRKSHNNHWTFCCKVYIGANIAPNAKTTPVLDRNYQPQFFTIVVPFSTANQWSEREDFETHILFDDISYSGYSHTSGRTINECNIGSFQAGYNATAYIYRIAIYRGIDDDRAHYNHMIDKARFGL